ncbi:MAG TPA: GNAT family protein [Gaiellaceae bacterium]|nr:GNAT family protein [Gaiellaceae bacterium]
MPRRLTAPALADEVIRLDPLHTSLAPEFAWILQPDEPTARYTLIPSAPTGDFLERWLGRYEQGWDDGTCAGFAIRTAADGSAIGFAAFVHLDRDAGQAEIGYVVAPAARGRGAAARSVELLTDWGFGELGLERIELRIDPANTASTRVAERAGYRLDGVLRSVYFKESRRADVAVWSRLASD